MFNWKKLVAATGCAALAIALGGCQHTAGTPPAQAASPAAGGTVVTRENFVRAETDRMFADTAKLGGGVNRFFIFRSPTPLDQQVVVRMNRDTLYAGAVVDSSAGATITLPPSPGGRYFSLHLIDNDHYDLGVISTPGTHPLPVDSGHIFAAIRIQLYNPGDPAEVALVNAWQDKLAINAKSARPFVPARWDKASLDAVRAELEAGSRRFPNMEKAMLPRGKADSEQHLYGAACCWGLLPATEATYFTYSGGHSEKACRSANFPVPKNRAFWSITVYNEKGFIAYENAVLNSSTVKLEPDGSFTAYFGSKAACGERANRLDTPPGWNTMMRVYRPDPSVLNGGYVLPATTLVKQ